MTDQKIRACPSGAKANGTVTQARDFLCLSHLRWDFVFQRPQHLLSRAAREHRVFYWEEPADTEGEPWLEIRQKLPQLWVVVPHLPSSLHGEQRLQAQATLLDRLIAERELCDFVLWYYTPNAFPFAAHLQPAVTVYDCMDELSAFHGADPKLRDFERQLFIRADLVFTGGQSLYEAKLGQHHNVYLFASSIDRNHFAQARQALPEPPDQAPIPHPRLGFFGVVDERMDLDLLDGLAQAQPDWHLVMIGPVVKINPAHLPRHANLHWLGAKSYADLPSYLAGWDLALIPFARNEATQFISPTKTPEYLAGGIPVISTGIRDVVRPYGQQGLARIASTVPEFVTAVRATLDDDAAARNAWLQRVDTFLAHNSWDLTWNRMKGLIEECAVSEVKE